MYPLEIVAPMKAELTDFGFKELLNASDVENMLKLKGSALIVINSVCGCSAGACRPGVLQALNTMSKKPDHLYTCFAGYDIDAIQKLREHLSPLPPSSPAIAFFKDGELVHFIARSQIEQSNASTLSQLIKAACELY